VVPFSRAYTLTPPILDGVLYLLLSPMCEKARRARTEKRTPREVCGYLGVT
jgi:hypothetical protein